MLNKDEFKKLINGKIIPNYASDTDYKTNAPSFYEYLARNNELLQLLAERIWGYDEEINEYFQRWEDNLASINEDVIEMMIQWFNDGTLNEILNNELLAMKPEIIISQTEPDSTFPNLHWYHDVGDSGIQTNIKRTNVKISDKEPEKKQFNVWGEY